MNSDCFATKTMSRKTANYCKKLKHMVAVIIIIAALTLLWVILLTQLLPCTTETTMLVEKRMSKSYDETNYFGNQLDHMEEEHEEDPPPPLADYHHSYPSAYEEIDCLINDEYIITGRRQGNSTFIPFSFLAKHFEVNGELVKDLYDKQERLEWHHSTARVYEQKPYKADGTFMTFEHYHVEQRSKVKYISGVEGVPISVQWDPKGYFYPIQISQFGLSHYTKNLTDMEPVITILENAEDGETIGKWRQSTPSADVNNSIRVVYDEDKSSKVLEFRTPQSSSTVSNGFVLQVNSEDQYVISFDALFIHSNFSICIVVKASDQKKRGIRLIYNNGEDTIDKQGHDIIIGLGQITRWRKITRNLLSDYRKGTTQTNRKQLPKSVATLKKIVSIQISGRGRIDNLTLSTHNHLAHFVDAADWLQRNQDAMGGWPIAAERRLDKGMSPLKPGWYSAMAQGQAISVLTRAYKLTGQYRYLYTALLATKLYTIPSSEGGVLAKFLDIFPWYEEYPTTPSSFVLNGFIFSLIGLYDLKCIASVEEGREAARLYIDGMTSLKAMINLYDTGSGSIYDLRHVTLQKQPNLARWDYHATHIAQLQLLTSIDDDPVLTTILDRWIGYTQGRLEKRDNLNNEL